MFDLIALWLGRILLIVIMLGIIALIPYWIIAYLFNYSPTFRFATFLWLTQKAKNKTVTRIHTKDGKVWEFKEISEGEKNAKI